MRPFGLALALAAALALAPAAAAAPYAATPTPSRARARFTISYSGSGTYHTVYHSNPPNPGGSPDTNDATDSSTQSWSFTFDGSLAVQKCKGSAAKRIKRCIHTIGLSSAHGKTSATGQVKHTHIDGLYPADDASASCQLSAQTPPGARVSTSVTVTYLPNSRRVAVTLGNPVADALNLLPGQCPSAPDGIDGLNDNYFTPGFSFAVGYGPDRWFTSSVVSIPISVLRRTSRISIPLTLTKAGTPPPDCAVPYPSYQRCITGGAWSGTLTLSRKGS